MQQKVGETPLTYQLKAMPQYIAVVAVVELPFHEAAVIFVHFYCKSLNPNLMLVIEQVEGALSVSRSHGRFPWGVSSDLSGLK